MDIKTQQTLFPNPDLRHILTGKEIEADVTENNFAPNLMNIQDQAQRETCIAQYAASLLSQQADAKLAKIAKRLIEKLHETIEDSGLELSGQLKE